MADIEAAELLYRHLGGLPDPDFGTINLLPFAQDSEETNAVKRRVCEAIVQVFENGGYSMTRREPDSAPPRALHMKCRSCDTTLLTARVDKTGAASVPGTHTISSIARMTPECPHRLVTLEDQRRRIEEGFESMGES